jgi:glycosyltransferase involved in cell wall biosynthesis
MPRSPATLEERPWPRISVVIPSYNQGEFIEEAIRSVILQGYPNLELIVMDGGSSDQSVEIIRKYESWIAYWVSEKDDGQSAAINAGWDRATGEIVAWLNADDLYCENALLNAARRFLDESDVAMIYGYAHVIDKNGDHCGEIGFPEEFNLLDMLRSFNNIVPSVTMFVRKRVVEAIGALRRDLHLTMDFEFVLRIALYGPIRRDRGVRSLVRIHEFAKSSIGGVRGLHELYVTIEALKLETRDRKLAMACSEGLALGGTRLSIAYSQEREFGKSLLWRLRSIRGALLRIHRKEMIALLVPGRLFPFLRKYRADDVSRSVQVLWTGNNHLPPISGQTEYQLGDER